MKVREFNNRDVASINKWLKKRGHVPVKQGDLPAIGFIVPGVAAGFLRSCEGQVGIFDGLVTNPYVSADSRHLALQAIFNTVLATPGFNTILGFTTDVGALERALGHGFKPIPHTLLIFNK